MCRINKEQASPICYIICVRTKEENKTKSLTLLKYTDRMTLDHNHTCSICFLWSKNRKQIPFALLTVCTHDPCFQNSNMTSNVWKIHVFYLYICNEDQVLLSFHAHVFTYIVNPFFSLLLQTKRNPLLLYYSMRQDTNKSSLLPFIFGSTKAKLDVCLDHYFLYLTWQVLYSYEPFFVWNKARRVVIDTCESCNRYETKRNRWWSICMSKERQTVSEITLCRRHD